MVERASLAVDAANLEIMRLDGILENVDAITSSAASATEAVDTVANAPLKIVNAASEKLREALSGKKTSDESAKLAAAAEAAAPAEFAAIEGDQAAACAPEAHALKSPPKSPPLSLSRKLLAATSPMAHRRRTSRFDTPLRQR